MLRRGPIALALLFVAGSSGAATRFTRLAEEQGGPIHVTSSPRARSNDAPRRVNEVSAVPSLERARAYATSRAHELWPCRDRAGFVAELVVELSVRPTGRIQALRISPSTDGATPFERCIQKAMLGWRMPSYDGERADGIAVEAANLSLPFRFQR